MLDLHYSAYRWKFYGHALNPLPEQQKLYPLKVSLEEQEAPVRKIIGKDTPAVQVNFDYIGLLNGRVEFFYDLRLAGGLSKEEISDTDFYLYRYVRSSQKLVPVADVVVDEDGWASVVLTKLENTTYVFTDSKFGGEQYERYLGYGDDSDDDEPVTNLRSGYYRSASNLESDLEMFDTDPALATFAYPFSPETEELVATMDRELSGETDSGENASIPLVPVIVIAVLAIGLMAGAGLVIVKMRKGKGE